jgi:hypothetical protein
VSTDIALRRLVDALKTSADKRVASAASSIAAEMDSAISADIAAHAAKTQFVHGVGSLFVAKTSNPTQYVRWSEIADKPDLSDLDIGTSGLEIDASQVTTGTFVLARLPVAASGENSTSKVVRADDMRLTTHQITAEVAVPLYAGMFVTMRADGLCEPASNASEETAAVGFVTDSFTVGQMAQIFTYGQNSHIYLPLILGSQVLHPFYLGSTPGYATMTMPLVGIEQQLGVITSLVSTTVARGMVVLQKATAFVGV